MIRILLVTKHAEVREGLCTMLRLSSSLEVVGEASNGGSAAQQAGKQDPDAALVDLEMPDGEGYETIYQLRRLYPKVKVIALTAHDYPATWASALQAGAKKVIVKGMDLPEMEEAFRMAVSIGPDRL